MALHNFCHIYSQISVVVFLMLLQLLFYFLTHCWYIKNINDVFILTLHAANLLKSFINPIIYQWFFGYSKYQIILCMNNDVFFLSNYNIFISFPDLLAKIYSKMLAAAAAAAAKLLQSCPTLCNPVDGSPPGSPVPGILQARTLEWVPFPSPMHESEKWKWSRSVMSDSSRSHGLQPTMLASSI